jgi:shikimate kinase
MPGIDPNLLDALSPPALEEDPVTVEEYKTMLKTVLGEKAMPAMEAAAIKLSITAPGVVIGSGGGSLSGSTLSAKLPIIDLLVLEKPIEVWIRWRNAG